MTTLSVQQFGEGLLRTNDLDPVYVALWKARLPHSQLLRLILAYSCLYHLGAAAKLSEFQNKKYWDKLEEAAINEGLKWPRNSERRHFRGAAAIKTVESLRAKYTTPELAVHQWFKHDTTFTELSRRVQEEEGYGPWIAFKLGDLAERLGWPVDFSDCELGIYKDPKQGAALYVYGDWGHPITPLELKTTIEGLVGYFYKFLAPPRYERRVNVQEVESILCKWKSYMRGHYTLGHDIAQVRKNLVGWGPTAEELLAQMPVEVL